MLSEVGCKGSTPDIPASRPARASSSSMQISIGLSIDLLRSSFSSNHRNTGTYRIYTHFSSASEAVATTYFGVIFVFFVCTFLVFAGAFLEVVMGEADVEGMF